jgi:hypothetical protein
MMKGFEEGFNAANRQLRDDRKHTPLYCPPEKVNFTSEQLIDILRRWVEAKRVQAPGIGTAPPSYALLYALEDAFPCAK